MIYTAAAGYPAQYIRTGNYPCFGSEMLFTDSVLEAKRYKLLPHLFFPTEPYTIWVDANIKPLISEAELINRFLPVGCDFFAFAHPYRSTVYQEFEELRRDQRFALPWLQRQLREQEEAYQEVGLPASSLLYECNFLIRANNPRTNRLMDAWWAQVCRWQWRDQVSFPYVLWQAADIRIATDNGNIRKHPLFEYVPRY